MSRSTWAMGIICLTLFILLLQDQRKAVESDISASRFIFDIDGEEVTEINIFKKGEKFLSASRLNSEDWVLTYPVATPASPFAFAAILNFISAGQYQGLLPLDNNPEQYGLKDPTLSLVFTANNTTYGFDVSSTQEDKMFLRRKDKEDTVYLVLPHFFNYFNQETAAYRMRTVFSFNDVNVTRIAMSGSNGFTISKPAQNLWIIEDPFRWPGAPDMIAAYLSELKSLRIKDFVKDNTSPDDLQTYGLGLETTNQCALTLRGQPARTIEFGRKDTDTQIQYFRFTDEASVYSIPLNKSEILQDIDRKLFRNRNVAVFPPELISKITLDNLTRKERITVERAAANAVWECKFPDKATVSSERINNFLESLQKTQIINFTLEGEENLSILELDKPDIVLSCFLKNQTGQETLIYRLNLKDKGSGVIYGNIDKEIYGSLSILRISGELYEIMSSGLAAFKSLYLTINADEEITWLSVAGPNRVSFETKQTGGKRWDIVTPTDRLPNMRTLQQLLALLSNLKANTIETLELESLTDYGFDDPRATVKFTAFATPFTLVIGKVKPGTTDSYAYYLNNKTVYTLSKDKVNTLLQDTGNLIKLK